VYGVPRKTLNSHLKGLVAKPGQFGRYSIVLGMEFEAVLVQHAVALDIHNSMVSTAMSRD